MMFKGASMLDAIKVPSSPFPGLRPFDFHESHLFFGRDGQIEKLIAKLDQSRFLAVVGTSGSGKSSLVRAGLLPALLGGMMNNAGSKWRLCVMRPGNDPIGSLAHALNGPEVFGSDDAENAAIQITVANATLRRGSRGLVEVVQQNAMPEDENLLVVVDQFEELFRFAREATRREKEEGDRYQNDSAAFVKLFLEAKTQREVNIFVVLTMRSDFLGDCSKFWNLPEAINESQYLIPRLTRDQLREVITGPIALCGGQITSHLVTQLLNEMGGDTQDQLPVLQHLLMRVWNEWKEKRLDIQIRADDPSVTPEELVSAARRDRLLNTLLTKRKEPELGSKDPTIFRPHSAVHKGEAIDICCYQAVGGLAAALSRHADEAFLELPDARHREVAEKLFKALTEKGQDNREIRRPLTLGEASAVTGANEAELVTVIDIFRQPGRSFLMPPAGTSLVANSLIDISHESLIRKWDRLNEWVNDEARTARIYRRLAETAMLHKEGGAGLWRDPDLHIALKWRETGKPNEEWARRYHPEFKTAMSFLDKSRRRKWLRRVAYSIIGVAVVGLLLRLGVQQQTFLLQKARAQEAVKAALAERKAQEAQELALTAEKQSNEAGEKLSENVLVGLKPEAAELARKLIGRAHQNGIEIRLTSGYRSADTQASLYARGFTATKFSTHNTGLAFDIAIVRDGALIIEDPDYDKVGLLGEELGLIWGGSWKGFADKPHFETKDAKEYLMKLREANPSSDQTTSPAR
jgi:uncharacterized protein YcbK (DUF882 family)/energy-coupling factor transporter ATP-binding protein EcfA2